MNQKELFKHRESAVDKETRIATPAEVKDLLFPHILPFQIYSKSNIEGFVSFTTEPYFYMNIN